MVQIKGLSPGKHLFEYPVGTDFFKSFDNQRIQEADLTVKVELEKRPAGTIDLFIDIAGSVTVPCDRCLDDVIVPVATKEALTVRQADVDDPDHEDNIILLRENEGEFDLSQHIYDFVCLSLPLMTTHAKGKCNKEMISRLNPAKKENVENTPFSNLKDLLKE